MCVGLVLCVCEYIFCKKCRQHERTFNWTKSHYSSREQHLYDSRNHGCWSSTKNNRKYKFFFLINIFVNIIMKHVVDIKSRLYFKYQTIDYPHVLTYVIIICIEHLYTLYIAIYCERVSKYIYLTMNVTTNSSPACMVGIYTTTTLDICYN